MEKLYIIKIGGNVIDTQPSLDTFISDFSKISGRKILVHGGGKVADELAKRLGISQEMVNGRRITDEETLKIVTMVYAGLLNKRIVALLQSCDANAVGLSGADLNSIRAGKRAGTPVDYGFAGDIEEVNTGTIAALIESGIVPVFCSVTHDGKGQLLNTNADTIASALAVALSKTYEVQLNYCFEKNGVLKDVDESNSLITTITQAGYKKLLSEGAISKGMIPKLDNSFEAINKGVKRVVIGHSGKLKEIIGSKKNCGTILTP